MFVSQILQHLQTEETIERTPDAQERNKRILPHAFYSFVITVSVTLMSLEGERELHTNELISSNY